MSDVTVSTKRNRVYQRKFDHEEAIARYKAGESQSEIARSYGVTPRAVRRVVDPREKARMANSLRQITERCTDCGQPCSKRSRSGVYRCPRCAGLLRRKEHWNDKGELICTKCKRWLHPSLFPFDRKSEARGFYKPWCRECGTKARQAYRERRKVPCRECGDSCLPANEKGVRGKDTGLCRSCFLRVLRWERRGRAA